jgi:outer membrane lipoprotein carrier protein
MCTATMHQHRSQQRSIPAILLLLFILVAGREVVAAATLDDCVRGLEQRYRSMQDLSARFDQETLIGSLKRVEKGAGMVYFKKSGKMLWEYTQPAVQKIYLDGKNLWFYLPEDKQVLKNDMSRMPSDITLDLFAGKLKIKEKFTVRMVPGDARAANDAVVLQLIPKTPHPNLKSLTLWVDRRNYYITRSSLEDEIGNRTQLTFSAIAIDTGLSDSLFIFTPPPGVEIYEPPTVSSPNPSP